VSRLRNSLSSDRGEQIGDRARDLLQAEGERGVDLSVDVGQTGAFAATLGLMPIETDANFLNGASVKCDPGNLPLLTVTTLATRLVSAGVAGPPVSPPMVELQAPMAWTSSSTMFLEQVSSMQSSNLGMMVSAALLKVLKAFWMSVTDLFMAITGTAAAKAVAPAARTVKMVEKRMVK